jgi:hypothetical protein
MGGISHRFMKIEIGILEDLDLKPVKAPKRSKGTPSKHPEKRAVFLRKFAPWKSPHGPRVDLEPN